MRSLDQERMRKAYEFVQDVKQNHSGIANEYSSLAKKLPAMIVNNGLITTMVFLRSKAKKKKEEEGEKTTANEKLLEQLLSYIISENQDTDSKYEIFRKRVENMDIEEYLFLTQDVLAFATWLKRIAEGEIEDEKTERSS